MKTLTTENINDIRARLTGGGSITPDEAQALYASNDIHTLGELADIVRERLHGRKAYYNVNRHINYSNYCVLRCKFCSFYRPYPKNVDQRGLVRSAAAGGESIAFDEGGGYEFSVSEIVEQAKTAYAHGATEVHIVGGLHPKLPFSYYVDMCGSIRETCPHIHIKAFTAIEIIHFSRIARPRLSIAEVLTRLQQAGLGSLPGGGAEIFDDRVHDEAFKNKVGQAEWFDVHRTAHELGIFTNATILYGHVETPDQRIAHLVKLREHQARSLRCGKAYFNCVVPLSFIPHGSALSHLPGPTGLTDLKTLAISRLICDNIQHIKAFWIMQSVKLAQVSLNWGVDDIDGTVVHYDITKPEPHALACADPSRGLKPRGSGGSTHQELTVDKLKRLIREAGCVPVERDTLYRRVIRDDKTWHVEGEDWRVEYRPASPQLRTDSQMVSLPGSD